MSQPIVVFDDHEECEKRLTAAENRAGELAADLIEARRERDEARDEVVRLGREGENLAFQVRELKAHVASLEAQVIADAKEFERLRTIIGELGAAEAAEPPTEPCDRTDLPEQSDMRCPCGFEAGEHLAWRRRYCRNRRFPEHGRRSPCVICGYLWEGAQSAEPPTDDVEAFLRRAHDQMLAHLDRVVDVDARLAEVKRRAMDGPGPGCPAHGLHPHYGMRCLDCPECVGPPEGIEALRPGGAE